MSDKIRVKPVVLLVEDEGLLTRMYSKKLNNDGYECIIASNGKEALEMAKGKKPDMILSDIMMPEMDGIAFLKELKKDEELQKIPVVMLTNLSDDKFVEEALEIGAVSYIVKNQVVPADVVKKVKEVLEATGKKSLLSK
jgi:CheY-like chemotaxis protein